MILLLLAKLILVSPPALPAGNKSSLFLFCCSHFFIIVLLKLQYQGRTRRRTPDQCPPGIFVIIIFKISVNSAPVNEQKDFNKTSAKIQQQLLIEETRHCVNCIFGILVFVHVVMPIEKMQSPDYITFPHEIDNVR